MGVAGLWDVLKPAGVVRSLTDLAIQEGFQANPDKKRGFRLGIDASIWFFHAEYGREGENPVLRTLFFRCATLMHTTFLPLFVFDGPKRPNIKRGKRINKTSHALIPGMKAIVEAFGFEWRMAPGEAEAELAYLNRIGIIDGVLSDDVDNFLFGAKTVIRNSSNTLSGNRTNPVLNSAGKDDKNHSRVFRIDDINNHPEVRLTQGGMILIGLMSGGDYQQSGLMRCGVATATALARCGFGDSLYEAAMNLDRETLEDFLVIWRQELREELRTNSKGEIGRKQASLAKSIPDTFPDIEVLLYYVKPITSQTMGRESNNLKITWEKEPDVAKLAGVCEMYFEWGYKEAIIKRFRTVMWHSIVLRILRRAVLDLDQHGGSARIESNTPKTSKGYEDKAPCGTPSKMIAKHFASLELSSQSKVYVSGSESEEDEDEHRLIVKIHSAREHPSTDGLPEYRLEIAPKQLVALAESGIEGRRAPEGPDEWASEGDEEDGGKRKGKREPIDPETHLRVWMPACMVELVEPGLVKQYKDLQEEKRLKKAKKGTRTRAAQGIEKTTSKSKAPAAPAQDGKDSDVFTNMPKLSTPRKRSTTKSKWKAGLSLPEGSSDDDELPQIVYFELSQASKVLPATGKPLGVSIIADDELLEYDLPQLRKPISTTKSANNAHTHPGADVAPPACPRTGIRDLTTRKQTIQTSTKTDLKSFFSTTKSSTTTVTTKARPLSKAPLASLSRLARNETIEETLYTQDKPAALSSLESHSLAEEYDVMSRAPTSSGQSSHSSPSKRKAQEKSTHSSSDFGHSDYVTKSPRKKVLQQSARLPRRLPSPSCSKTNLKLAVIEISSESDSDLPSSIIPAKSLPPLLRAKARVASGSSKASSAPKSIIKSLTSKNTSSRSSSDIIDLT